LTKSSIIFDSLDVLLEQLVLVSEGEGHSRRAQQYGEFAYQHAERLLRLRDDERMRRRFETRLRLAMHLAPADAIAYDPTNPVPRWKLVQNHVATVFERSTQAVETVARDVATVLDNWDRDRGEATRFVAYLTRRDGPFCGNCRMKFGVLSVAEQKRDVYKPYHESPEELTSSEVDHVEPVSGLGTDALENLQLLCRLCNGGKGDGLGIEARMEARHAGTQVELVPRSHRARILYYVIERDGRDCSVCGSVERELTVRPIVPGGAYVRSNLHAVCVGCAF
jgi:5-methylcytosine-specific restriction endonuclease McrA